MTITLPPIKTKRELRSRLAQAANAKRGYDYLETIGWHDMSEDVQAALKLIVDGRNQMRAAHLKHMGDHRDAVSQDKMTFAIDGRMVGDLGQLIAEKIFAIRLCPQAEIDAVTTDGTSRRVQVKATFLDTSLSFRHPDDLLIAIQLHDDGLYRVLYNGPARIAFDYLQLPEKSGAGGRIGAGARLEPIGLGTWALLDTQVNSSDRVPRRVAAKPRGDH